MSKSKIQFQHNIKKIKEQRQLKKLLIQQKTDLELNYITSNFGKVNIF